MSLNLGTEAVEAARELRESQPWRVFREALFEQVQRAMNAALDASGDRDAAVGYARALRDLHIALDSATSGTPYNRTPKPAPVGRNASR